jgi:hypothetical protein
LSLSYCGVISSGSELLLYACVHCLFDISKI